MKPGNCQEAKKYLLIDQKWNKTSAEMILDDNPPNPNFLDLLVRTKACQDNKVKGKHENNKIR